MDLDAPQGIPFEIAAELASQRVPIAYPRQKIGDLRRDIAGESYECASHIAVCEDNKFVGLLRVEELFAAPAARYVGEVMDANAPTAIPGLDQEIAAWRAVQHDEAALAVVDGTGRFIGIIPPHRLLAVLLKEHDEDMARLGGVLKESSAARLATEEPLRRRFWHRLPWLLFGLVGALLAADLVGWFETKLQEKLILAFFIPGIVYLADAVGTQTETVIVRGLSVGVAVGRVVALEALTGVGMGVVLALVTAPVVYWHWGDYDVALIVALAILAAASTATLVAMTLPWLLSRLHLDPAFGSGPLATVVQDLLSILLYFLIAAALI